MSGALTALTEEILPIDSGLDVQAGGAVANVGLTLAALGVETILVGLVGRDPLGELLASMLARKASRYVTVNVRALDGHATSTTLLLKDAATGCRFNIHCPGVNNAFSFEHVDQVDLSGVNWLHFGYPALMRSIMDDGMRGLRCIFQKARSQGALTSLDLSRMPVGFSSEGFYKQLRLQLPFVDLFAPSIGDLLDIHGVFSSDVHRTRYPSDNDIRWVADQFLSGGAALVCIKLGARGIYIAGSSDKARMQTMALRLGYDATPWLGLEHWQRSPPANSVEPTGAGDALIAGLICAIMRGASPGNAAEFAQHIATKSLAANGGHASVERYHDDLFHL